ncbi:MAG: hypothetical protein Q8P22_07590 [Chloroflexota bacterium]|nr:hypothetical protein [Chloroflexota bacterium]
MASMLSGKHVWIWNWQRCDGGNPDAIAERLKAAGCAGAIVKAHDGPNWFDQGQPWREIGRALKSHGLRVAGWGYLYGPATGSGDWQGEADRAIETIQYGEADAYVLDVEAEFEGKADVAEAVCQRIREAVGPDYPLYYSTFAIARYHRDFPYMAFERYCNGTLPQVYWNAFGRWPMGVAVAMTYDDYGALGIGPERIFPVAGLYAEGRVPYPDPFDVIAFIDLVYQRRGGKEGGGLEGGCSFWSYEHMSDAMWQAVAANPWPVEGMPWTGWQSSDDGDGELARLRQENAELAGRIERGTGLAGELMKVLRGEA